MIKKIITGGLFLLSFLSLIVGIHNQYKSGHLNFSAISNANYPIDLLIASYIGSLAIPIILFFSAYHLGKYSFLKNTFKFHLKFPESLPSRYTLISFIAIILILIAWFLIGNLSFGTYEDCILDGKTGRTNAELNLLKKTCRAKFPALSKLSKGNSTAIYCEMNSIANYKSFDGYIDFKNKIANVGPVKGDVVSSNKDLIVLKIVGDTQSIWDEPNYSKLDLQTGDFSTNVNGVSDTTIGNCVEK